MSGFQIGGLKLQPGQRGATRLPVTRLLVGAELALPVVAVRGMQDGPVLGLTCAIHGAEHFPIQIVRRLMQELDPAELHGALVAVPVANPLTFAARSRIVLEDDIDFGNMNRIFPGVRPKPAFGSGQSDPSDRTSTEMMAAVLDQTVFPLLTHMIDWHCHMEGVGLVKLIQGHGLEGEQGEAARGMCRAFDLELIHEHGYGANTASGTATRRGVAVCIAEVGGGNALPLELELKMVARGLRGARNVMRYLGMLPGEPEKGGRQLLFHHVPHVRPLNGGYLLTRYDPSSLFSGARLGVPVRQGDLLGTVFDPYTLDELEEMRSPADGILYMARRSGPIEAGGHAYAVADFADSYWTEGV